MTKIADLLKDNNLFLTGGAGTGKTYTTRKIIETYPKSHIGVVAPTGIASQNIVSYGQTLHKYFKLPIGKRVDEKRIKTLRANSKFVKKLEALKLLVIDEISMVSKYILDDIDYIMREMRGENKAFGGVRVLFVGDFFQLPPIPPKGIRTPIFSFQSKAWKEANIKVAYLKKKYRQKEGDKLVYILDKIREGKGREDEVVESLLSLQNTKLAEPYTRLYARNVDVSGENLRKLAEIDEKEYEILAGEAGLSEEVERIYRDNMVQKNLKIKVGATVLFIKNSPSMEYYNGTIGVVTKIDINNKQREYDKIEVDVNGKTIIVKKSDWLLEEDGTLKALVSQYPIILGWAITIHKSQGMTLERVEANLDCFVEGQGYVGLSRATGSEGLRVSKFNMKALDVDRNILHVDKRIQKVSLI
jgi:ATP-dependent exoDNAse (exonuclease V) alpha subunit